MDYYQELGLKPTATREEIHQAYKLLARLLHPDGRTDPQLREMADRQMQRLNEMFATLTNEHRRRRYDTSLVVLSLPFLAEIKPTRMSRFPDWGRSVMRHGYWLVLAVILLSVGVWYAEQGNTPMPMELHAIAQTEPASPEPLPAQPSFAGTWRNAADSKVKPVAGANPVISGELRLVNELDELWGIYHAKYWIPDTAMSQEVNFRVTGKSPRSQTALLDWTADDGASGEAQITLRGPNRMQVSWWATRQGRQSTLNSGTANLLRQPTR